MRRFATKLTKVPKRFNSIKRFSSTHKKTQIELLEQINNTQEKQLLMLKTIQYSMSFGIGMPIGHTLFGC